MDGNRFDRLSRVYGKNLDRRGMFKATAAAAVAALGVGLKSGGAAAATGFNGDVCSTGADCRDGLVCEGNTTGLLGGSLAGIPFGPGIPLPFLTGTTGRCRYRQDSCGREGQACRNNSDCCNGEDLFCPNNTCRRRR